MLKKTYILVTQTFQKNLRKLRRHLSEEDIRNDIREFIRVGLRKGESRLKTLSFDNITIVIVKLRIRVNQSSGRYLLGIINEFEYIPIFIDLKTGIYGKNMSFETDKRVVSVIQNALENVLTDYLEHTEESPRVTKYLIDQL